MGRRLFTLCLGCVIVAVVMSCTRVFNLLYGIGGTPLQERWKTLGVKTKTASGERHDAGTAKLPAHKCYRITPHWEQVTKSDEELRPLECSQKLPSVLIIGARTSGAKTLNKIMGFHPQVAAPVNEVQFFDKHFHRGLAWYKSQMPYSTPGQITVEATENYMYHRNASLRVRKLLGDEIKVIVILRDPVARSISDYLLTKSRIRESRVTSAHYKGKFKEARMTDRLLISTSGKRGRKGSTKLSCTIQDTFEETVLKGEYEVYLKNIFIADSLYVYYLRPWIKKFTSTNVLVLNAEKFARTPAETLSEVEKFLGLKPYFQPHFLNFDLNSSRFCLEEPQSICMEQRKIEYPHISKETITKIREHFESTCRYLFLLLKHYLELIGDIPLNYHLIE